MKKLLTSLRNFRYGREHIKGPIQVEWFHYDLDEDDSIDPRFFSNEELNQFQDFTVTNETNFGGGKEYLNTTVEEIPNSDLYNLIQNERLNEPENLIITPTPNIQHNNGIATTMFIILTDDNGIDRHEYYLPFGVIGRIIG